MNYEWENKFDWNLLKNKKILVAGGTGFIGKRLIYFFEKHKIEAYVITRQQLTDTDYVKYLNADLSDIEQINRFAENDFYDILIYMAANIPLSGEKKESYFDASQSTLMPFINFCTAYVNNKCKLIYISSVDVLGACGEYEFDEEVLPNVTTPYGLAKYCGEFYAKNICAKENADYLILRFAQVYGPDEPIVRIIPIIKNAILNKKRFELWTDGSEKRRFLYVDDAVQAIICGINSNETGIFNIAGNEVISMAELVTLMEKSFGINLNYDILNKISGVDNIPDIKKAIEKLNFMPEISLKNGMDIIGRRSK